MEQGADDYEYIYGLGPDQPPTGVLVKPELRRKVLYNMSPTEVSICSIYIYPNRIELRCDQLQL